MDRFWEKVDKSGDCWEWTASLRNGYGQFRISSPRTVVYAHRLSYELCVGPIPEGLQLDHLCRNTGCVNPEHLEPVTHRENARRGMSLVGQNARKTSCVHGHPFDETNTRITPDGKRACRACARRAARAALRRNRLAVA